jgi:hypothetical protein
MVMLQSASSKPLNDMERRSRGLAQFAPSLFCAIHPQKCAKMLFLW